MVKPLIDLNYNFGIVSGMNVALLFLDYDWDMNPMKFRGKALAVPICIAAILPTLVKIAKVTHSSFMNVSVQSPRSPYYFSFI